ncbi:MAG: hypothetical protein RIT45_4111 [Pseudomonadota bacterium]|jgi:cardiolipin synthase
MTTRVHRFRRSGRGDAVSATVGGNRVTLLHDHHALGVMLEAIGEADSEILLEMYWFESDQTGWSFANALCDAAEQGVRVRVVYDAVGSLGADEAMFAAMRRAGCLVHEYHPVAPWRQRFRWGRIGHRNHRKLLVVDGDLAMLGGVNLADHWADPAQGGGGWRDDMVAIEGPAATAVRGIFEACWGVLSRPETDDEPDEGNAFEVGDARVRVLGNHYRDERKVIRGAYLARIERAERSLYIANPYFVPDRRIRRALARAVRRGVDVRVLVPGINDVPIVAWASRSHYTELLRAGVRIFEWQGPVLHAKSAAVDDSWLTIGTYNLDTRSWRYNLEINAMIEDGELASAARRQFLRDLERADEVRYESWRNRPLLQRLLEGLMALFSGWL